MPQNRHLTGNECVINIKPHSLDSLQNKLSAEDCSFVTVSAFGLELFSSLKSGFPRALYLQCTISAIVMIWDTYYGKVSTAKLYPGFLQKANRPTDCDYIALQNQESEHLYMSVSKAFNEDSRQSAYLLPLAYSKASAFRNSR